MNLRLRSRVTEVVTGDVSFELIASQERTDKRSVLRNRVMTSSFRMTPPAELPDHDSSMATPSLNQRSDGAGIPVYALSVKVCELER